MLTQCLQCRRIQHPQKGWLEPPETTLKDGRHIYCPECDQRLVESVLAVKSFPKWSFEEQILFLRKELQAKRSKVDSLVMRDVLAFYSVEPNQHDRFIKALEDCIVPRICHLCLLETSADDSETGLGGYFFHPDCGKNVDEKLKSILSKGWDESGKLDAYLDMLEIPKHVRQELKLELYRRRQHEKALS